MNYKDILAMASAYKEVAEASAKQRALANVKAQPKDKVSLAKAPWEKKKDTKKEEAEIEEALDAVNKKAVKKDFADRKDKDIDNDGDIDSSDEYLHKRRKAVSKAMKGKETEVEVQANEEVELDENKAIIKIYQDMKAQGKKDHNILDYIGSMPKYKRISRDQMAKIIGDAKRKGIFKEDVEITELHMSLLEAHGIEKKVAARVKKVFDDMSDADKAAFMKAYLKNPKAATEYMFKGMKKMAKEEVEIEEASQPKWIVTVVKPINKLKKGMKVIVPARNTAEALKKALKRMGENIDAAIGSRHLDVKLDNGGMKKMAKEEVEYLEELTAAEKKLIAQMYDKKGNLTPLGKKVMDHGKAASKLTPKDAAADNARRKEYNAYQKSKRNEEVELDENKTAKMLHKHMLKALGKSKLPKDHGYTSSVATNGDFVVSKGGSVAGRLKKGEHDVPAKMSETVDEAKDHGNTDNGSKAGEGLSPSAKKELDRKTPMLPATDEPTVDNLNFKTFKTMTKKAPMRSGDNASGDKTAPKTGK